jgi:hypothetical protein
VYWLIGVVLRALYPSSKLILYRYMPVRSGRLALLEICPRR